MKAVLNHSAWANHYGRQVAPGWNAGNTRSYAVVGPSGQTQFMSARHATAVRKVTGESRSGSGRSRYEVQGSVGGSISSSTFVDAGKEIQDWARSDAGKDWSFWLSNASIGLPALGMGLKHPIAIAVGVGLGSIAGIASTGIDCLAAWRSPACIVGGLGISVGPIGIIVSKLPRVTLVAVESAQWVTKIIGWNADAVTWIPSAADWWDRNLL